MHTANDDSHRSSMSYWNRWYASRDAERRAIHVYSNVVDQLTDMCGGLEGKRILEVGCGRGQTLLEAVARGAVGTGLDRSEFALDAAHRYASAAGIPGEAVEWILADARQIPFPAGHFDAVYSVGVLEHFANPEDLLRDQVRVLRPGGVLVAQVPQTFNVYTIFKQALIRAGKWPYGWETQFSPAELRRLLKHQRVTVERCTGYGSFTLGVLRKLLRGKISFEANLSLWRAHPALQAVKSWTSMEVCVAGRKAV